MFCMSGMCRRLTMGQLLTPCLLCESLAGRRDTNAAATHKSDAACGSACHHTTLVCLPHQLLHCPSSKWSASALASACLPPQQQGQKSS